MTSHPDLPLEQARNAEYLKKLKEWLEKPAQYGVARNEVWVNPTTNGHGKSYGVLHPLIGRVGLTEPDEFLGRSFYIGARRFDGDMQTVSWLAPVARAFFHPHDPPKELGHIAGIRTFTHHVDELTAVDEEWFARPEDSPFAQTELAVEAPRSRTQRRRMATPDSTLTRSQPARPTTPEATATGEQHHRGDGTRLEGMRAAGAVLHRLAEPRSNEMVSVLATLQPDQHDLVTRSADADLVIQGHPGTGKTVVAAYRAGFLITPNDPGQHEYGGGRRKVLLIGPTREYVEHVASLIKPFQRDGAGHVTITDMGSLMADIVSIEGPWSGGIDGDRDDVDAKARRFAEAAARLVRQTTGYKVGNNYRRVAWDNIHDTYTMLRNNGLPDNPIATERDEVAWLRKLPPFERAIRSRRYLPLLTQCRLAQKPVSSADVYDHIIVDEAQDVSPIEWNVIDQHRHPRNGRWTLVGDLNQRRSLTSYTSWQEIADHLGIGAADEPFEPDRLNRGYRSTNEILRFADGLLMPALRLAGSIQHDGPPVRIERITKSKRLLSSAATIAAELARKYPDGTVALISARAESVVAQMATDGWRRPNPADMNTWTLDGATIHVYPPEGARGLEFDAVVVVVEPRQYDSIAGRHGQLYTSLTRANRELAVVHHQSLPAGLRTRGWGRERRSQTVDRKE